MSDGSEIRSPELILADSAWLRGFTRKLVQDADLAEDVCQDALVAGFSSSNPSSGSSRPWLARVARNIAISLARRQKRRQRAEQAAPGNAPAPGTADLAAELELQRLAVQALSTLHEPYQTALLYRFMKGLSARETAKQLDVPLETVRARIKRGLALLRAKLDRDHGGRRGWLAPIATPAIWKLSTTALWGIVLMKMKAKALLAASVFLVGLFGIWYVIDVPASSPSVPQDTVAGTMASAQIPAESTPVDSVPERSALEPVAAEAASATLLVEVTWRDNGLPATDVGVQFWRPGERRGSGSVATTNSEGTARFTNMPPGQVRVSIDRMGANWDLEISEGKQETLEIDVPRAMDVRGIVVDPSGLGVSGAQILVTPAGLAPQTLYPNMTTEADGTFFLRSLGTRLIAARAEGYGTSDLAIVMSAEAIDGEIAVRLVLPGAPAELVGTVYGPEGKPVQGAHVIIGRLHPYGSGSPQERFETDAEGRFHVRHLKPDQYPVFVYTEGLAPWTGAVECLAQSTAQLSVQLQPGADLYGIVTDGEGTPLQGVDVNIPDIGGSHRSYTSTDETGRYRLEDLPAGQVTVTAVSSELDKQVNTWHVVAGQDLERDIVLNTGPKIHGILLDPAGNPLVRCWVMHKYRPTGAYRVGSTDAEGRFVLANCEEGKLYSVRVQGGMGFLPALHVFENVSPGPEEQTFRIPERSMPSARIVGRVLAPDGSNPTRATLSLEQSGRRVLPMPTVDARGNPSEYVDTLGQFEMGPIDEQGNFEIGLLPAGEYEVTAYHPDYATAEFGTINLLPGEVHQLPVRRFGPGAKLGVTIHHGTPEQLLQLQVELHDLQGKRVRTGTIRDQQATFPVMEPGSYKLSVTGANIETQSLPIELKAGQTLALEIYLR